MEAKDRTIKEFVIGKDVLFTIPPYQRKYTWEFKKEVKTLIDDIEEFINDEQRRDYFLGSVITKAQPTLSKNYLLVDGQQRITTFFLLIAAINKIIISEGPFKYNIQSILETDDDKFKLNRINDFNTIKKILNGDINNITDDDKETQYWKVYSKLVSFLRDKEKFEEGWIERFYDKGIANITLAVINLNENEDEFLVFESINSKGKNLSSGDLIKNYIMMNFKNDESKEKIFENSIVEKLDEKDLVNFYRQVVALETGKLASASGKGLYYAFRAKWPKESVNMDLINYLQHKLDIWEYIHSEDFGLTSYPLVRSGLLNFYTMISALVEKNSDWSKDENLNEDRLKITNKENILKGIKNLSLTLIKRTLGGRGRVESNRTFSKIGHEFYKSEENFNEAIKNKLEKIDGKAKTPSWEEIDSLLSTNDVYSNQNIIKNIFVSIEEHLSKKKQNESQLSVEHIYPQNPSEDWDLEENEQLKMASLLHTLGNISITNDNSALGNNIFVKKKEILEDRSYLKINKMIYDVEEWNSNEIKVRAQKIISLIKEIWE